MMAILSLIFIVTAFSKLQNDTLFIDIDQRNQVLLHKILLDILIVFFTLCCLFSSIS